MWEAVRIRGVEVNRKRRRIVVERVNQIIHYAPLNLPRQLLALQYSCALVLPCDVRPSAGASLYSTCGTIWGL